MHFEALLTDGGGIVPDDTVLVGDGDLRPQRTELPLG